MTIQEFFAEHPSVAIAFSGGVDSSYLLYAAKQSAQNVCAYYAKSAFQPEFEYEDAGRLCQSLGIPMTVVELDVLADADVTANPADRCYFCKRKV